MDLAHRKQFNVTVEHGKLFRLAYLPEKTDHMTHGVIGTLVQLVVAEGHIRGQEVALMDQMEVLFVLVPMVSRKKSKFAMISFVQTVRILSRRAEKKVNFFSFKSIAVSN